MSKTIVLGGTGQIGSELKKICPEILYPTRLELDLSSPISIERYFADNPADLIINLAAYTKVDQAEAEQDLAFFCNGHGLKLIGKAAPRVIHVSTDYVFDGRSSTPYDESHPTSPVNAYGKSKELGERELLSACPNSTIIRTSWVYSTHGNNFFNTIRRLSQAQKELRIIFDQIGTPTPASELAALIKNHAIVSDRFSPGIYHYSNEGVASWYDFAKEIVRLGKSDCHILPILTKDYPSKTVRPHFSVLNKEKIKTKLQIEIPHWRDSLERIILEGAWHG
jgi:dTDP-4-dehydrorhamnose reductase